MWLPDPLYEALPYLYLVIGTLFLGGAVYLGIGAAGTPYYFALGILCVVGGVVIYMRRISVRQQRATRDRPEIY
jgi:hypothetical protein